MLFWTIRWKVPRICLHANISSLFTFRTLGRSGLLASISSGNRLTGSRMLLGSPERKPIGELVEIAVVKGNVVWRRIVGSNAERRGLSVPEEDCIVLVSPVGDSIYCLALHLWFGLEKRNSVNFSTVTFEAYSEERHSFSGWPNDGMGPNSHL